ncbi:MAG: hypothetical protein HYV17_07995 [Xanthomonadales bacterium]|nr:hypothetical protein [Xanthomonadales bacterium]
MSFSSFIEPRRRGFIVALLAQSGEQGANVPLVVSITQNAGYRASADVIKADLAALRDLGLLTLREIGTLQMARIEQRGRDFAGGQFDVPGLERVGDV